MSGVGCCRGCTHCAACVTHPHCPMHAQQCARIRVSVSSADLMCACRPKCHLQLCPCLFRKPVTCRVQSCTVHDSRSHARCQLCNYSQSSAALILFHVFQVSTAPMKNLCVQMQLRALGSTSRLGPQCVSKSQIDPLSTLATTATLPIKQNLHAV